MGALQGKFSINYKLISYYWRAILYCLSPHLRTVSYIQIKSLKKNHINYKFYQQIKKIKILFDSTPLDPSFRQKIEIHLIKMFKWMVIGASTSNTLKKASIYKRLNGKRHQKTIAYSIDLLRLIVGHFGYMVTKIFTFEGGVDFHQWNFIR